ncbi:hypothetical protein SPRG_19591 [Saprolegnia parasitica CBS 223.65]|uniref:Uncharacterized protein n=1 Tax=Saprolegnia parasitica (strain CBS 223.65) TaxID=695850 RepID=A0A067CK00_SAPPC|nr:hypothetical protein SPRG_19591 [Saprolegnia parasitica CBS 223.65]KDO31064.1 hypothetical protein SPRG_19591 [Saprolegnia parasitica CBS 223.65]|eukprot:XP_012198323.1 hypothetical protein SPRG_19591 [Saprolegnia parasitica CBS 223.65]
MCHKISCSVCQKATWQGCGQHIQSALQGVPEAERCPGWRTGQHQDAQSGGADK